MRHVRSFNSQFRTVLPEHFITRRSKLSSFVSCLLVLVLTASVGWAAPPQAPAKGQSDKSTTAQPDWSELNKYPGLLEEYGRLLTRFQREIKMPPARSQSGLLRLMPQSTTAYGAFPNYGGTAHQALDIFRQELNDSSPLRDWWQHSQAGSKGPNLETALERYCQLSEYLGDEVVASGTIKDNGGGLLLIAEVKKPGLEAFLRSAVKELAGEKTPAQVLNLRELATAKDPNHQPVILVRPDLVIFSTDLKTVRSFNTKLSNGEPTLDTTAFGKRLSESYQRGVEIVMAADLQTILSQLPQGRADEQLLFQRSGFADAKYAIWEYADVSGQAPSQGELSFIGPRRGIASWLAAPSRRAGLDFVAPDASLVMSALLKNPAEIFADIKALTNSPSSQDTQKLANLEPILMPILSQLTGDITLELDAFPPASAEWKVILGTRDGQALRQSLSPFLAALRPSETVEGGETYYQLQIPNGKRPMEISYSFQQGHLVLGSSQQAVAKSVLAHRSGESLGNSEKYRAALPPGHSAEASAIMYQNSTGFLNAMMSKMPPEISRGLLQSPNQDVSVISALYGEETAIRQASKSGASGVAPAMIVAAIAIPNLLRARIAANEASAVGSIRTLNTAQVVYASTYPERGFSRDLATLGIGPRRSPASAVHAGLVDNVLGCATGTTGNWCTKSGYKFTIRTNCTQQACGQFVAVATPVSTSTGQRNFCSTSDAVVRFEKGPPLTSVISASQCKTWEPIR
jgi:hypothetical protein